MRIYLIASAQSLVAIFGSNNGSMHVPLALASGIMACMPASYDA